MFFSPSASWTEPFPALVLVRVPLVCSFVSFLLGFSLVASFSLPPFFFFFFFVSFSLISRHPIARPPIGSICFGQGLRKRRDCRSSRTSQLPGFASGFLSLADGATQHMQPPQATGKAVATVSVSSSRRKSTACLFIQYFPLLSFFSPLSLSQFQRQRGRCKPQGNVCRVRAPRNLSFPFLCD